MRNMLPTFGATTIIVALTLGTSVLLARNLGAEGRGLLLALTFWPALWTALFNLSLNEAITYRVARADGKQDEIAKREIEASGLVLQLGMAFASAALCMVMIATTLPEGRRPNLSLVLWYSAAFAPLSVLDQHFRAVLQGRGALRLLNVIRLIQPTVYAGGLLSLAWLEAVSVESVMAGMIGALACSTVAGAACTGIRIFDVSKNAAIAILNSGCRFHLANVLLYAAAEVDKFLVLQLLDDSRAGYYAVAVGVSAIGSGLVVQSVGLILGRQMSALIDQRRQGEQLVASASLSFLSLVLINGVAAVLAPWWVPLMFGQEFVAAVPVAMILLAMGTLRGTRQIIDRGLRAAHVTSVGMVGEGLALAAAVALATVGGRIAGLEGMATGFAGAQACALAVVIGMTAKVFTIAPIQYWSKQWKIIALLGRQLRRELDVMRARR
jgi:O-antigen/teichoic acid export membrane protein